MPDVLVAGGNRLHARIAVVDGEIEDCYTVATGSVGRGDRVDRGDRVGGSIPGVGVAGGDGFTGRGAVVDGEV